MEDIVKNVNVIIAGVGGQGTVLAARLLAGATLRVGLEVRGSETIGMAQRGGSVTSHVRMGHDIASPLLCHGQTDVIIAFEPGEAARATDYLAPDGIMIISDRAVMPSSAVDSVYNPEETIVGLRMVFENNVDIPQGQRNTPTTSTPVILGEVPESSPSTLTSPSPSLLHILNGEQIIANCGAKSLNVALLAYATSLGVFPFTMQELEAEVIARSGKHANANAIALKYGTELTATY
jgi:indolepyruvate ferredoxin oxidoreductase beta subunit